MMKRQLVFFLLGARHNFNVIFYLFNLQRFNTKFLFLAVLLNLVGKLCRLSYCMYISLNSSKTILKENMEKNGRKLYVIISTTNNNVFIRSIVLIIQLPYQNVVHTLNTRHVLVIISNSLIAT